MGNAEFKRFWPKEIRRLYFVGPKLCKYVCIKSSLNNSMRNIRVYSNVVIRVHNHRSPPGAIRTHRSKLCFFQAKDGCHPSLQWTYLDDFIYRSQARVPCSSGLGLVIKVMYLTAIKFIQIPTWTVLPVLYVVDHAKWRMGSTVHTSILPIRGVRLVYYRITPFSSGLLAWLVFSHSCSARREFMNTILYTDDRLHTVRKFVCYP